MSPPPLQLQKLAPYGRLKKLPSWFASPKDVAKITLGRTELEDDDIKVLQNLCLRSLRILSLVGLGSVKSLRFEGGAMPDLRRLAIKNQQRSEG